MSATVEQRVKSLLDTLGRMGDRYAADASVPPASRASMLQTLEAVAPLAEVLGNNSTTAARDALSSSEAGHTHGTPAAGAGG